MRLILFLLLFMSSQETGTELDLVFILNTPLMMSDADLSNAVDFMYNVTDRLTIGQTHTLVSALTYSELPTQHFNFTSHSSKAEILNSLSALKSINRSHDVSNSNEVLDFVRTTTMKSARTSSSKLVVLIVMQGPAVPVLTEWAAEDLTTEYNTQFVVLGLDSLTSADQTLLLKVATDESRIFYVRDFRYSCNVVPNVTNIVDSAADTSPIQNCPDPNAVPETTTTQNVYSTKDDSLLLVVIGAIIGTIILLATLVFAYKYVKGNVEKDKKDKRVMRAVEVYREAPLGTSKVFFCHEELGKSSTEEPGKFSTDEPGTSSSREEARSAYVQRLTLTQNFVNVHA